MSKFKVGDRVTIGGEIKITGIQTAKKGTNVYQTDIGLCLRDGVIDKLTVEKKEDKPEPIMLYCVKDYMPGKWLTKGKIYEFTPEKPFSYDGVYLVLGNSSYEKWCKSNPEFAACLVPLVKRPAKVGEWVYIEAAEYTPKTNGILDYENGDILKVIGREEREPESWARYAKGCDDQGKERVLVDTEYLVLDGYNPVKKMTIEEISKELGYKVEVVK